MLGYRGRGTRSCLIDRERLSLQFRCVKAFDGRFSLQQFGHFEECKPCRSFIETVSHNIEERYFTECLEQFPKFVFSHFLRQITGVNIHGPFLFKVNVHDVLKL